MRFSLLIAAVAAIKITGTPQEVGIPTCPTPCLALPNRVSGIKKDHKIWPSAPVAAPLPLANGHYGVGDTVTA